MAPYAEVLNLGSLHDTCCRRVLGLAEEFEVVRRVSEEEARAEAREEDSSEESGAEEEAEESTEDRVRLVIDYQGKTKKVNLEQ